jgi:hypothetical protein
MKTAYITLITVIASFAFFAALSFVAYKEQEAINKEQAKFAKSWCDVDFGSSKATIECNKVSRLERK